MGQSVDALRKEDLTLAAFALAFFLAKASDVQSDKQVEAICRAVLMEQGIKDTAKTEKAAVDALREELSGVIADENNACQERQESFDELKASMDSGKEVRADLPFKNGIKAA